MNTTPPNGSSRSFRKLVESDDDLAGLIAFGLYRIQKEEWADDKPRSDDEVLRYSEVLTKSQVNTLRASAEQMLERFADSIIAEFRPQIEEEVRAAGFTEVVTQVQAHVDRRTHWKQAVWTNLLAWVITVGLTAAALVLLILPELAEQIAGALRPEGG